MKKVTKEWFFQLFPFFQNFGFLWLKYLQNRQKPLEQLFLRVLDQKEVDKINIEHCGGVFSQFWLYDFRVQSTWDGTSEIKFFCQNPFFHIQKSIFSPKKLTTLFKKPARNQQNAIFIVVKTSFWGLFCKFWGFNVLFW